MNEDDAKRQKPVRGFTPIGDLLSGFFPQGMTELSEAGEVEEKSAATTAKKLRQPSAKLVKAAAQIMARPSDADFAFLAREVVQCTLPHRDPGDVAVWVRRNGDYLLGLQPHVNLKTGKSIGLPYGSLPRLLMLWIVTEANRNILKFADPDVITKAEFDQARRIKLGDTLNEFLRALGLDTGRGKRGYARRLRQQMQRLFRCKISFEYSPSSGRHSWLDMQVADEAITWWDDENPDQPGLFQSEILLGEKFFKAITAAPVPLDVRALMPLKSSPMAIDLYTWATYRVHTLQNAGRHEVSIPLELLKEQFGAEYGRADHFKAALSEALAKVQLVYPALDYTLGKNTFVLRAGRHAVQPRSTEKRKALAQEKARQMSKQISAKAHEWFAEHYGGWNIEKAIADFEQWRDHRAIESANTDAHFRAFVKKWAQS
jgi:hypothetical protein